MEQPVSVHRWCVLISAIFINGFFDFFSSVCAVASRYYEARPNLYSLAMEFARDCAGKGLVEGDRSVEVCQAYLILAVYPVPKKKWVEDRSWLLMGVAIRRALIMPIAESMLTFTSEWRQS